MSFDAGSIESTLTLDRTPFQAGLQAALGEADKATKDPFKVRLDLDRTAFDAEWDAFQAGHADELLDVQLRAVTAGADTALDAWRKTESGKQITAPIGVDTAAATARLDTWRQQQSGKNISFDVNTSRADQEMSEFGGSFSLMAAGIVAAAPFVGAAIEGGIGAGFVAIAVLAQHSNADVQASYTQLWKDVKAETQNATNSLVPVITDAGHEMDAALQGLGPELGQAMSAAGPDIVTLTGGLDHLAQNALPGVTSAMQASEPTAVGFASLLGQVGSTIGDTASSVGQNSAAMGTDLDSLGSIVRSVIGAATTVVDDLATAWAANAGTTDQAVAEVSSTIGGLATGVLPVVSTAFGVVGGAVDGVMHVLGPIAPVVGGITAAWLILVGAAKLSSVVTAGVNALAGGIVTAGGAMEAGAARAAGFVAGLEGVDVEASETAVAMTAAGDATADFAVTAGAATEAIAGPLGIALVAGVALLGLFMSSQTSTKQSAEDLKSSIDSLTSAFEQSHGQATQSVVSALQGTQAYKDAAQAAAGYGVSQSALTQAVTQGGPALDQLRSRLQGIMDSNLKVAAGSDSATRAAKAYESGAAAINPTLTAQGQAAEDALLKLNDLVKAYDQGHISADQLDTAQQAVAKTVVQSSSDQAVASSLADQYGLSLKDVSFALQGIVVAGGAAAASTQAMAEQFVKNELAVSQAKQSITDYFTSADQAVQQAESSVDDAQHSFAQSQVAVTDAIHSQAQAAQSVILAQEGVVNAEHAVGQAHDAVTAAIQGVISAEQSYTAAQRSEQQAEVALNQARQQAIQDLISLHLQYADQVASTENANVGLFDATKTAADLGVTQANAQKIAAEQVTDSNEAQVKAAIALVQAMNQVNDSTNTQTNLKQQVSAADKAGISGAQGVINAQQALASAQQQVVSSAQAVVKAHQQVDDAEFSLRQSQQNLVQAQTSVANASYNEQKASQAVADAQYNETHTAQQLTAAKAALKTAHDNDSRSFDLNTKAGQNNLSMLLQLWDAIQATGMPQAQQYQTLVGDVASEFGISTGAAQKFLKQIGLIKPNYKFGVTAVADVDLGKLPNWEETQILLGKHALPSQGGHSQISGFADGGLFRGAGGTTDDRNMIAVSDKEYIVNAEQTQKNLPLLHAINNGAVPGFSTGGQVDNMANNLVWGQAGISYMDAAIASNLFNPGSVPLLPAYVPSFVQAGGQIDYKGPLGVTQWAPQILAALKLLGQPASWLGTVEHRMNQESGGNPTIVNLWDSNAKAGHPSVGLMQVIRGTYDAYAGPYLHTGPFEYGVSVNPEANIYAGLNYAEHRYGTLAALNRPGGYDNGGPIEAGYTLVYNGTGKPENVRTSDQEDEMLQAIRALAVGGKPGPTVTVYQDNRGHQYSTEELAAANSRHLAHALGGI